MIIECTNCHAKYQYDEDRFERKPAKRIKCAKCGSVFEIHNPAFATPHVEPEQATTAPNHDQTVVGKPKARDKDQEPTAPAPVPDIQRQTGKQSIPLQLPMGKRISLAIIDGPDAGSVFRLEKPRVTIGRSNADLTLNDTEASRQHAAVEVRESIFLLNDLGSSNGTVVDGRRISEPTELQNQSEFQVGGTTLMLIVTEEG